jgi:exonuclease III
MAGITTYLSMLTLNVNGLSFRIKRHRLGSCIKKEELTICCLQEIHLTKETSIGLGERLKKYFPSKWPPKTGRNSYIYVR